MTIKGIVDREVVEFENTLKRSIDVTNRKGLEPVFIQGLRSNNKKGFRNNRFLLSRQVYGVLLTSTRETSPLIRI